MQYTKQPLSVKQQIEKLKSRGLIIDDETGAANCLSSVSYYRLRAYTYPFQNKGEDDDHCFIRNDIHFRDIIDLYCFDSKLRLLLFNAIEKIEIAVRAKITYEYALGTKSSHWFLEEEMYFKASDYPAIIQDIQEETDRSNEDFIKHYNSKYDNPALPPSWMTLEILSFGTLSHMFSRLDSNSEPNKSIVKAFGLPPKSFILENWLHAISVLRNCCAHHSRIWNRRFPVSVKLPYNTANPFIDRETAKSIRNNKLFALLCCIKYMLDIISPENDFRKNLITIINQSGKLLKLKDMGFPENWMLLSVWKEK
jgi:abortive infection bacteriophage resistance protein